MLTLIGIVVVVFLIMTYNKLVSLKNIVKEAWSGIDVQLSYRHNLIPNLCNTVKGYATHEKDIFENIAKFRSQCISATDVKDKSITENALSSSLKTLFAVAENYPELKANENFLDLQRQLANTEDNIQKARRYYNGTARDFNTIISQFPSNIVAVLTGFNQVDFFELEVQSERELPEVKF